MVKGLLLGIVVGAALAGGGYRAYAHHRHHEADAAASASSATAPDTAPDAELEKAKIENLRLQADLVSAKAEAAKAGKKPEVAAKIAVDSDGGVNWKDVGSRLYKMRDKLKSHDESSPEIQELWTDLITLLNDQAKKDGATFEEILMSPEGMIGLLFGLLEGSDLPMGAGEAEKLEALKARLNGSWKDYLGSRETKSGMERQLDLLRLTHGGLSDVRGAMTPEQSQMIDEMEMFKDTPSMHGRWVASGPRDLVAKQVVSQWQKDLGLDETQGVSLTPIVDEYMRELDAAKAEQARTTAAGEKVDEWAFAIHKAELMLAAQKRISETLRLSEAQAAALKKWNGAYDYTISEPGK